MTKTPDESWRRIHKNGTVAEVRRQSEETFSFGVHREAEAAVMTGDFRGSLGEAQRAADRDSGCRQMCGCPPWSRTATQNN